MTKMIFMAKMKQLREMPEKDVGTRLAELRLELSKERAASEIGTAKNPGRIGAIRRDIARILTIQNEKRLGIGKAKAKPTPKPAPKAKEPAKEKKESKKPTEAKGKGEKIAASEKSAKSSPSPLQKSESSKSEVVA